MIFLAFNTHEDKKKFEYIYDRYNRLLLYKAYEVLRDQSLAEDAVSEAFIRIYKNLNKVNIDDAGKTAAFLVIIARNCALTILSKQRRDSLANIDDLDLVSQDDVEGSVISNCTAKEIMKVIGNLKDNLKEPFLLKFAYNMSHKEIAELLNLSESNVTVRIHRAKAKLAKLLQEGGFNSEHRSK